MSASAVEAPAPRGRLARVRARWSVSPRAHAWAAYAALLVSTLIVYTGAGVRLTASGLGCAEWPHCSETSFAPTEGHAYIEFGNRMVTTPVALACGACLLFALLRRPYRRDFTRLGALLSAGVFAQAVLGGITVLTELNPVIVAAHFLLSMLMLYWAVTLVWRVRREAGGAPDHPVRERRLVHAVRGIFGLGVTVLVIGTMVTAAGPHGGDPDELERLTIFGNETFSHVITAHARLAAAFGLLALAVWWLAWRRRAPRDLMVPLSVTLVLVGLVGLVGHLQYHVLAYPAGLVWVHVMLAATLFNALVWSLLAAGRPGPQRASR